MLGFAASLDGRVLLRDIQMFYKPKERSKQPSNKPLTLHVERLAHDLRGIAHAAGKTVFVDNALPGEQVEARIQRSSGRYIDARAVKIEQPSADRQAPRCQHFGRCGGCSLQYLRSEQQITHKQHAVLDQLQRFGGVQPAETAAPLLSDPYGYRYRARLAVYYHRKQQQLLVGFRESRSRQIIHLSECPVLARPLQSLLEPLQQLLNRLSSKDTISHLDLALSEQGRSVLFRHIKPLSTEDETALEAFAREHLDQYFLQPAGTDSVHCAWNRHGSSLLRYSIPAFDLTVDYLPVDFTQVNPQINRQMVVQAMDWLQLSAGEVLLDLFCGLGNFSLPAASLGASVIGVEGSAEMVERASRNAEVSSIDTVRYLTADLTGQGALRDAGIRSVDKVLLDPPRAGASGIIDEVCTLRPTCILYISCDSATLARDAAHIMSQGYVLQRLGVMDMFPQTSHVESMALFVSEGCS